jgi:drug/metabolite transporter superfamily protein YnfA
VRPLKAFGLFWYELLVGDDWKLAASVVLALLVSALVLTRTGASDEVVAIVGGLLVVAGFCVSMVLDVRRQD